MALIIALATSTTCGLQFLRIHININYIFYFKKPLYNGLFCLNTYIDRLLHCFLAHGNQWHTHKLAHV